jgi:hypothetical protein
MIYSKVVILDSILILIKNMGKLSSFSRGSGSDWVHAASEERYPLMSKCVNVSLFSIVHILELGLTLPDRQVGDLTASPPVTPVHQQLTHDHQDGQQHHQPNQNQAPSRR